MRGCVRVTGRGVESVLEGCYKLSLFDVSQCKNLIPWLSTGGVTRWGGVEVGLPQPSVSLGRGLKPPSRGVKFVTVSQGLRR